MVRRLLWAGPNRTAEASESFFDVFDDEILPTLKSMK